MRNWQLFSRFYEATGLGLMANERPSGRGLSPLALPLAEAAAVLSRLAGQPITEDMLRRDIAAGAPANPDGSINLVEYAAWLVEVCGRGN